MGKTTTRPYIINSGNVWRDKALERQVQSQIQSDKEKVGEDKYMEGLKKRMVEEQARMARVNAVNNATLQKDAENAASNLERMEIEGEEEENNPRTDSDILEVHASPDARIEDMDVREKDEVGTATAASQVQDVNVDVIEANMKAQIPSTSQGLTREDHITPIRPDLDQATSSDKGEEEMAEPYEESYEEYDEDMEGELLGLDKFFAEGEGEEGDSQKDREVIEEFCKREKLDVSSGRAMVRLTASLINIQASLREETSVRRETSDEDGSMRAGGQADKGPDRQLTKETLSKREKRERKKEEKKVKRAEWKEKEKKATNVSSPPQDF